jgi:hypothetical protein
VEPEGLAVLRGQIRHTFAANIFSVSRDALVHIAALKTVRSSYEKQERENYTFARHKWTLHRPGAIRPFPNLINAVIVEVEYAANRFGDLSGFTNQAKPQPKG